MEKKSFRLIAMLFVAVLTLGFTSCGDDDDDWGSVPEEILKDIKGTWDFQSGTANVMGYSHTMSRSEVQQMASQMNVAIWDLTLRFTASEVNGARYYVKGRKLIIEGQEVVEGFDITIQSLSSSTLVLRESFTFSGYTYSCDLTYRKV